MCLSLANFSKEWATQRYLLTCFPFWNRGLRGISLSSPPSTPPSVTRCMWRSHHKPGGQSSCSTSFQAGCFFVIHRQGASRDSPVSLNHFPTGILELQTPTGTYLVFNVGSRDLNSGCHTFVASDFAYCTVLSPWVSSGIKMLFTSEALRVRVIQRRKMYRIPNEEFPQIHSLIVKSHVSISQWWVVVLLLPLVTFANFSCPSGSSISHDGGSNIYWMHPVSWFLKKLLSPTMDMG